MASIYENLKNDQYSRSIFALWQRGRFIFIIISRTIQKYVHLPLLQIIHSNTQPKISLVCAEQSC